MPSVFAGTARVHGPMPKPPSSSFSPDGQIGDAVAVQIAQVRHRNAEEVTVIEVREGWPCR
ncbi:MAG: hypothetical protein R3C02_20030 [Planctomycetaceae bacterium]